MKVILDVRLAADVLRSVDPLVRKRLKAALRKLAQDPSGNKTGLDVKRLDSDAGAAMYRLRVGDWRVAFAIRKGIFVLRIFHRSDGYGWLADLD